MWSIGARQINQCIWEGLCGENLGEGIAVKKLETIGKGLLGTRDLAKGNYDYTILLTFDLAFCRLWRTSGRSDSAASCGQQRNFTNMSLRGLGGPRTKPNASRSQSSYEHISVRRVTPALGAFVSGVDLAAPSPAQLGEIRRALDEFHVLFFRNQNMSKEEHLNFGREFGDLDIHPAAPHDTYPELMTIATDENSARANGEGWHSDVSCQSDPPLGSILYIRECPETGGDTLFSSMIAAYDALSERMKVYLEGLEAEHSGEHVYRGLFSNLGVADKPVYPRAVHPVIRIVNGKKALYVNRGFTTRILGIPADESDAIVDYLFRHCESPLWQCRFSWEANSVAFWDNRVTQHRWASSFFTRIPCQVNGLVESSRQRDVGLLAKQAERTPGDHQRHQA